jgi:UPF0271 protein
MTTPRLSIFGETAIEVTGAALSPRAIASRVEGIAGVLEVVVGWDRALVHLRDGFAPAAVREEIRRALEDAKAVAAPARGRLHVVRTIYDGSDLAEVARSTGLSITAVAERHAASRHVVEVIGFLPGFAYLGGLDPTLACPRRKTPRPRIDPGSVAIAGGRSAIYPLASPGGWNLIGRAVDFTPFDPGAIPPCAFAIGDEVRFEIVEVACPR